MIRDAFTHPGKLGDLLAVLPAVAANAPEPVDFWTSPYCRVLKDFLERQVFVRRVFVSKDYRLRDFRHGARPREVPVMGRYRRVVHLGFPGFPEGYVPTWIARINGLRPPQDRFRPRFAPVSRDSSGGPHVACHFRSASRAEELREAVGRLGFRDWHAPSGLWTPGQFDAIASRVADAALFVGDFSCLSQVAALAGTPMVVFVEPARRRAIEWFRPPDHNRAWYLNENGRAPLPDLAEYLDRSKVL